MQATVKKPIAAILDAERVARFLKIADAIEELAIFAKILSRNAALHAPRNRIRERPYGC
jgi:hypothetical protein